MMKRLLFPVVGMLLVFSVGCEPGSPFPTELVEGRITLDEKPIENATINFSPEDPESGMPAFGRTDAAGQYKLTALRGGLHGKGTKIGKYFVTVILDTPEREPTAKEIEDAEKFGRSPNIPIKHVVPTKYNDPKTSGLTAEVVKGNNVFNFDLSTAPK